MNFTYRNVERSTDPRRIVRGASSLIVGAWPYAAPDRADHSFPQRPQGQIAAYAWRDHYGDLRDALGRIAAVLDDHGWKTRVVADDNALVDRAAARRAGIGWQGKNTNVLLPGGGSWYVLGAVVTDAPLAADGPMADGCGSCRRCLDHCPTGAIVAEGVVDARRCLAWLLQARGDFPVEYRAALGTRLYGCDDCQTACPPSRQAPAERIGDEVTSLDLLALLADDDDAVMDRVGRWYIPGRDVRYVRRNALVALGNATIDPARRAEVCETLDRYEFGHDGEPCDPMLARHARWARERLDAP